MKPNCFKIFNEANDLLPVFWERPQSVIFSTNCVRQYYWLLNLFMFHLSIRYQVSYTKEIYSWDLFMTVASAPMVDGATECSLFIAFVFEYSLWMYLKFWNVLRNMPIAFIFIISICSILLSKCSSTDISSKDKQNIWLEDLQTNEMPALTSYLYFSSY